MKKSFKKIIMLLAVAALLVCFSAAHVSASGTGSAAADPDGENLVITVVENIPAADIEENEVPLASPQSTAGFGTIHIVMLAALAIIIFFIVRDVVRKSRLKRVFAPYVSELKDGSDR